jgi:hypothetical protein
VPLSAGSRTQAPAWQTLRWHGGGGAQTVPQVPQLWGSVAVLTHAPLQQVWPELQQATLPPLAMQA